MLKAAQLVHAEAQFEIGMRKYSGEYENVVNPPLELVMSAGYLRSANAQAKIGNWYLNGYRVDKNLNEALKWLQKSATQFNHEAECDLGEMYFHGNGVVKDKDKGLKLLKRAADGGLVFAQHKLGCILYKEAKNYNEQLKGIKYIIDASNSGHVDSKIFLSSSCGTSN
jgi:TPR repeat protein